MNLRILKKLSRRAAPLLAALGDRREQFVAEGDGNYISTLISARKHWDRSPCHPTYQGRNDYSTPRGAEIVRTTRAGRRQRLKPPSGPRKGTYMVGGLSGYYQPEWDERSAWEALRDLVIDHFTDWQETGPLPLRPLRTPTQVFAAAADLLASL